MFDQDKWNEIFHVLSKNKSRTFLTAFGVFSGVFTLIVLLATGDGFEKGVKEKFNRIASNTFFIWGGRTTIAYEGYPPGRKIKLLTDDAQLLTSSIPEIRSAIPRCRLGGFTGSNNVVRGNKSEAFTVSGDFPAIYDIYSIFMKEGRFLNKGDIDQKRKVAVIGERVREVLFDNDENPIGEFIKVKGVFFKVIGVAGTNSTGGRSERDLETIYVPMTTFQKAFNSGNKVDFMAVTGTKEADAKILLQKTLKALREKNNIHPDDKFVYGNFNLAARYNSINSLFTGINVLIWIVGIGTLLAGIIGVSNILLIVVNERTQEFGLRRAIGAKPWDIKSQVILESIVLTTLAGIIGFIGAAFFVESGLMESSFTQLSGKKNSMFLSPSVQFYTSLGAIGMIAVFGALAGLLPAQRAVRIKPVDALRSE
ncbi:MAG: ABC transporter permease [Cyclobacteriaceae bacterium]